MVSAAEDTGALDALHEMFDPELPPPDPLGVVRAAGRYARAAGVEQGEIVLAIIGTEPVERDETTADCECCECCRDVPCLSSMRRGPCELLPCLLVGGDVDPVE